MVSGEWSPPSLSFSLCFFLPCPLEEGSDREAVVGTQCPVKSTHHTVPPSPPQGCSQTIHSLSVLLLGVAPTHVQVFGLGHIQFNEVHTGPLLKPVKVPRVEIPSTTYVNWTAELGVTCKLDKGTLNSTMSLIKVLNIIIPNKVPQGTPLDRDPFGHWEVDCNSLAMAIQGVPFLLNSLAIKSLCPQHRETEMLCETVSEILKKSR